MSDLEQLEGHWLELMQSKDPESAAMAFRLALAHLTQPSKRLQMAQIREHLAALEDGTGPDVIDV